MNACIYLLSFSGPQWWVTDTLAWPSFSLQVHKIDTMVAYRMAQDDEMTS